MTRTIRRGIARRLGLRPVQLPFPISHVTWDGIVHTLAIVGSRGRAAYLNAAGGAVDGPSVVVTSGMIDDRVVREQQVGSEVHRDR